MSKNKTRTDYTNKRREKSLPISILVSTNNSSNVLIYGLASMDDRLAILVTTRGSSCNIVAAKPIGEHQMDLLHCLNRLLYVRKPRGRCTIICTGFVRTEARRIVYC